MGIRFKATKEEATEIFLTEHSIKDIDLINEASTSIDFRHNNITRDIIISGVIDPGIMSAVQADGEPDEFDSVRALANWASIPAYQDCYKDVTISITNAQGTMVKQDDFKNVYIADYEENFDNEHGVGSFKALLREKDIQF